MLVDVTAVDTIQMWMNIVVAVVEIVVVLMMMLLMILPILHHVVRGEWLWRMVLKCW